MKIADLYQESYNWVLVEGRQLLIGLIVLIVGLWLIRLLKSWLRKTMLKKEVHSTLRPFFLSLAITALYILLLLLVIHILGVPLTIFTSVIAAFGVAAGLALSGTLQNFAGGVLILLLKPFEIDDYVVAQGQEGTVSSIQIFYTVLITADCKTVIIPNGKLFNEVIVNITREGRRRLDLEIKLGYAADVQKVKNIILDAIKSTPNIIPNAGNRVGISALEIDGVKFVINVWVVPGDFLATKLALQEKVITDLCSAGVKLPGVA